MHASNEVEKSGILETDKHLFKRLLVTTVPLQANLETGPYES